MYRHLFRFIQRKFNRNPLSKSQSSLVSKSNESISALSLTKEELDFRNSIDELANLEAKKVTNVHDDPTIALVNVQELRESFERRIAEQSQEVSKPKSRSIRRGLGSTQSVESIEDPKENSDARTLENPRKSQESIVSGVVPGDFYEM